MRATILVIATACAHHVAYVPGTKIVMSTPNKSVLDACEDYRLAVERQDVDALMLMASHQYWEDSGTPSASDDYGYDGLRNVLFERFTKASDVRYTLRYVNVTQSCADLHAPDPQHGVQACRAAVDVFIDASFTITNALGKPIRPDKRDQNQLVLEWDGRRWLFLSGM